MKSQKLIYSLTAAIFMTSSAIVNIKADVASTQAEREISEVADTIAFNAHTVFANLKSPALDVLTPSSRLDMIDYYDAGIRRPIINSMDGISTLDSLTNDYALITPSTVSTFTIKILPYKKDDSIVMTLYTVGADRQAPDTDIRFYDTNLKELPRERFFREPEIKDYLNLQKIDKKEIKSIENTITFPTFEFSITPSDDNILTGQLTVGEYMPEEDYKYIQPYIRKEVKYIWNGRKFELSK